jgi:hypothetical protein
MKKVATPMKASSSAKAMPRNHTDTDSGADGRESVTDRGDVARELSEVSEFHECFLPVEIATPCGVARLVMV